MSDTLKSYTSPDDALEILVNEEGRGPQLTSGKALHRLAADVCREAGVECDHEAVQKSILGAIVSGQVEADPETTAQLVATGRAIREGAVARIYSDYQRGAIDQATFEAAKRGLGFENWDDYIQKYR